MIRYFKTLILFWNTAVAVQLEYQINVLIEMVAMIGTLSGSIFILSLFFSKGNQIGNWSWEEALIVQGIYTVLDGFTNTWLRPNLTEIVNYIREGTLDFVLIKPIDSQFWISTRRLNPSGLPEILLGTLVILWARYQTGTLLSFKIICLTLLMLIVSIVILYSLWFLIASTSIWFVKTWNATEVLRAVLSAGRYPINAYPNPLRYIFTLILPITFLTTVPANVLLGKINYQMIGLGILLSVLFFIVSRKFWSYALRFYTSASS